MLVGRLPSVTRNGVWKAGEPSAVSSPCRLAEGERLGLREQIGHQQIVVLGERAQRLQNPMKSQGISFVPWCIS